MPKRTIPDKFLQSKWLQSTNTEVKPTTTQVAVSSISNDFNISRLHCLEGRGSPSLVGRGIANPMSERTRGFEMLSSRGGKYEIPTPRAFFLCHFLKFP
jgi:hypothetical protein